MTFKNWLCVKPTMEKCLYPYCKPDPSVKYFRVPDQPLIRKRWMSSIPRVLNLTKEDLQDPNVCLCSRHFVSASLEKIDGNIVALKEGATPSLFYIPSDTNNEKTVDDEEPEEITLEDLPPAPTIKPTVSNTSLFMLVRDEQLKVLICKEKIRQEEEEMKKIKDNISQVQQGNTPTDVEEMCMKLVKKMRPIAPKGPNRRRPKTLEECIVYSRKEKIMSEEACLVLLNLFADVPAEVLSPASKEGLSCFAQYLAFFNTEAMEKLLSIYELAVPSILTVRTLFNTHAGEPGWSFEAFKTVQEQAKKCKGGKKLLCCLLVTETNLKQKEEWDGKKIRGYVDCGPSWTPGAPGVGFDMDSDTLPTAKSVLSLMVVPLEPTELWRVPIAYFYVNRLTGAEKANIIRECILRLHYMGSIILAITCNVSFSDKAFLNSLGVSFELMPHICPYFVHPADALLRVHVVFDHCSLFSSIQNMWANSQVFLDGEGGNICWKYVSELIKLQEAQSGSSAHSYDTPQWAWDSLCIKNRLLAQLFSERTADAILYCCNDLKLVQFEGCEETVKFLRVMGKISKFLNSRIYFQSKAKSADTSLRSECVALLDYLYHLQNEKHEPLYSANCGSIRLLYQSLMSCQELLRQVPGFSPHCVSLDEAELVSHVIKTYTGWSSVPTARQFTLAFSKHVQKHGFLTSWTCAKINNNWWVDSMDIATARMEGRKVSKPEIATPCIPANVSTKILMEDKCPNADFKSLSSSNFIAICILKTLANILHCDSCLEALQEVPSADNPLLQLLRKTGGAFVCPSKDVIRVCAYTEHQLQEALRTAKADVKMSIFEWKTEAFVAKIGSAVTNDILVQNKAVFSSLESHQLECAPGASHLYRLVRGISCCYLSIRLRNFKSWCPI